MRILGFSKKWGKLQQDEFTTFRYPRKDAEKGRDWHNGEILKIVYQPRHANEILGVAQVINKEPRDWYEITEKEAMADGFESSFEMWKFLKQPKSNDLFNKLTLKWIKREVSNDQ